MAEEPVFKRGDNGAATEELKKALDRRLEGFFAQAGEVSKQLAGPPMFWDVVAVGPFQSPGLEPGRVIEVGQPATILTYVYLNPSVPNPAPGQNACDIITGFGAKIELNYFTSNTQTMTAVPALSRTVCIPTTPGQCWYTDYWTFVPQEAACLYETNICVRICNCSNFYVRQYSGFARWVQNLDYDLIFGGVSWQFDHPIRFMVSDYNIKCPC